MQKIVIKASDSRGETTDYIKMSKPALAEMVFYGLTHDEINQDRNWVLLVDGEPINWHCPNRFSKTE